MKRSFLFLLLSFIILSIACSDTLEDSIYDKKSDPHVDEPVIGNAVPSQESIIVRDILSKHCEEYCVYYKRVFPGVSQDEILVQDVSLWTIAARVNRDNTEDIIIEDLKPGEMYVIAVIGIDSFGNKSEPVFFEEKGRGNIAFLIPLAYAGPPARIKNIHLNLLSDGRTIQVNNIYDKNAAGYLVQYTRAWENNWQTITLDAVPGEAVEAQFTGAAWETYNIRVCGINSNSGVNGDWSDVMQISTDPDNTFSDVNAVNTSIEWINLEAYLTVGGGQVFKGDIQVNVNNMPENTDSYQVKVYDIFGLTLTHDDNSVGYILFSLEPYSVQNNIIHKAYVGTFVDDFKSIHANVSYSIVFYNKYGNSIETPLIEREATGDISSLTLP